MESSSPKWVRRWKGIAVLVLGIVVVGLGYSLFTRMIPSLPGSLRDQGPTEGIIQAEVRNGCGVTGLAATTTLFLRDHGVDVVESGDYESFEVALSRVIDRVGDLDSARRIAELLGVPEDRVEQDIRPDYLLDVSVVIGQDYRTLRPFRD